MWIEKNGPQMTQIRAQMKSDKTEFGLIGFHLGSFLVAVEAGIPVVPIVISGTRSALRGGQWFPRPSNISVHIGKALRADGSGFSAAVRLRDAVRARMLALCGEPDLALEKVRL